MRIGPPRDVAGGEFWSSSYQPTLRKPAGYEAIFSDARAEFRVSNRDFDSHTEIVVSPEDDIELRRLRITNLSRSRRSTFCAASSTASSSTTWCDC